MYNYCALWLAAEDVSLAYLKRKFCVKYFWFIDALYWVMVELNWWTVWPFAASSDNLARLWSVETGEIKREYSGHQKAVVCLAFNDSVLG